MINLSRLASEIGELLLRRRETLSVAESCTGGFISNQLTNIPGASQWFERGVVAYSNAAKGQWLGVPDYIMDTYGVVSKECAEPMATGIQKSAGTTYGLSVTGVAGPTGGTPSTPVGTVFIGLAHPNGVEVAEHHFPKGRDVFKAMACQAALEMLRRKIA